MQNLCSVSFVDFVAAETHAAGLMPQDIILEVTESCLLIDQRIALETLTRLRLKRFRLSIDDFGTGYSSLTQLNDIPFDELKIDEELLNSFHVVSNCYLFILSLTSLNSDCVMLQTLSSRPLRRHSTPHTHIHHTHPHKALSLHHCHSLCLWDRMVTAITATE